MISSMKNVQITVDDELLALVDRTAKPLGMKRSQVVRQALREWLQRQSIRSFEREWISALKQKPDDAGDADAWLPAQGWSRK
jgi:metal-responsive CopG/Arc/MetJ family transcriptional regulator